MYALPRAVLSPRFSLCRAVWAKQSQQRGRYMGGTRMFGRHVLLASVSACAMWVATPEAALADCVSSTIVPGTLSVTCDGDISLSGESFTAAADARSFGAVGSINAWGGVGGNGDNIILQSTANITVEQSHVTSGINASSTGGDGAINGSNGTGGLGGNVNVAASGLITVESDQGAGLSATSAGGTGAINGSGAGGHAGDVMVQSSAEISVSGEFANGIYASSSGGTGGVNGDGTGGDGGSVTVSVSGPVSTSGDFSDAIYAESSGGLGAINGNGNGGDAGAVSVLVSGNVTASGSEANGIRARSAAGDGAINGSGSAGSGSSVSVEISDGAVQGGSGSAYGVVLDAVTDATLSNSGRISALSGQAIFARGQTIEVSNSGAITGDVQYANDADGIFSNFAGGELFSGNSVNLNGGTLTNYGTVAPGGAGHIQTTFVGGNFNQPSGRYLVDADWASDTADMLAVTGSAELAGQVVVNPLNFPDSADPANVGLSKSFVILTADNGITDSGITAVDTAAVDYELLFPDANTMSVQATINFLGVGTTGLTPNQTSVGGALNTLVQSGGNAGFVSPLLTLGTQQELGDALDQLTPAGDAAQISSAMKTGNTFAGQLLSCRTLGEGDPNAFIREGQCLWVRANVRQIDNDGRNGETGFDETATFYSAGAQFDLGGPWRFGAGIGFEDGDLRTGSNARSETERLHLGGVIKYNPGPLLLAASLTGGHGWSDNTRVISFGAFSDVATSESDQSFISGRLTGAYLLSRGHWYAKPQVDLAWTHLERDGYRETSPGGSALTVQQSDDTVFSVSPSLEVGAEYALAFGGVARPYVKGGVTWVDSDTFITSAAFAGAPGAGGFAITSTIDDVVADLGLGVDFLAESGTVLRVQYDGQFGDQTEQHGGSAKLSVPF